MQRIYIILIIITHALAFSTSSQAAQVKSSLHCKDQAIQQAQKLLEFHFGSDDRIEISQDVKALASIVNPRNKKQRFDVLEVWGFIYKGEYRMRFEYYLEKQGTCLLMGQEILEYANI